MLKNLQQHRQTVAWALQRSEEINQRPGLQAGLHGFVIAVIFLGERIGFPKGKILIGNTRICLACYNYCHFNPLASFKLTSSHSLRGVF